MIERETLKVARRWTFTVRRTGLVVIATVAVLICGGHQTANAQCTKIEDVGRFKNKFTCPIRNGGLVRPGDKCAREGGGFRANRGTNRHHDALDLNAAEGTEVLATKPGRVAQSTDWTKIDPRTGEKSGMGKVVIIDHEDGDYSVYGHLKDLKTIQKKCVGAGEVIGTVGFTGNASCLQKNGLSPHLHFAIIRAAKAGLADKDSPIAKAVENANDWLDLAREFFGNDNLDLGVKDPLPILKILPGCLK